MPFPAMGIGFIPVGDPPPIPPSITFIGGVNSNNATPNQITDYPVGALIIVIAGLPGSATEITIPAEFTPMTGGTPKATANGCAIAAGWRIAENARVSDSGGDDLGTWTNATRTNMLVYGNAIGLTGTAYTAANASSITWPGLSGFGPRDWGLRTALIRISNVQPGTPPDFTARVAGPSGPRMKSADTAMAVASIPAEAVGNTGGANSEGHAFVEARILGLA